MRIVAFTGNSNSGKTTLIEKLSLLLSPHKKVSIIKHDPKDKAIFDTEKKDSDRFYKSGANVAIYGTQKSAIHLQYSPSLEEIINFLSPCDYLFIEGLKELPYPRICVARGEIDTRFYPYILALATTKDTQTSQVPKHLDLLDLDNTQQILDWINTNIKDQK